MSKFKIEMTNGKIQISKLKVEMEQSLGGRKNEL